VFINNAWSAWTSDGSIAGKTTGSNYVTRIQARLIQKKDVKFSSVSFDSNGGAPVESISDIAGNQVSLPQTYKCGFTFDGWYSDSASNSFTAFDMPENECTVYAKFTVNYIYKAGDADGDGNVRIVDLFLLKRIALGEVEEYDYI
jgi:uncharacterized repeat protein (TIGR02543 family)